MGHGFILALNDIRETGRFCSFWVFYLRDVLVALLVT